MTTRAGHAAGQNRRAVTRRTVRLRRSAAQRAQRGVAPCESL